MRKQFVATVEDSMSGDDRLVLLLGDIGVFGFRNAFKRFPQRVFNIGILEQATISLASGLAKTDMIPIVHTIAPFLVERSYEQLKVDFGYQALGGNFVSVGASYDYASLGCTHHCPGDVGILQNIPGMEIVVPGTAAEFDSLFRQSFPNGHPTYFRLSERENTRSHQVHFSSANVIKEGTKATVLAVGPMLNETLLAVQDLDVTVLYYTTVAPFDHAALRDRLTSSGKILLVEPYYAGTLTHEVCEAVRPRSVSIDSIGVPRQFLTSYGRAEDHDRVVGLTAVHIRSRLETLLNG